MDATLRENIGRIQPPGLSLKVLVNPIQAEIDLAIKLNGRPMRKTMDMVCGWRTTSIARTLKQRFASITANIHLCTLYWNTLAVITKTEEGKARIVLYNSSF